MTAVRDEFLHRIVSDKTLVLKKAREKAKKLLKEKHDKEIDTFAKYLYHLKERQSNES